MDLETHFWHVSVSRLTVASILLYSKEKERELLLPDVLQGKAEMRVGPHNRGEIQQRLKHDFLRKSRSQLLKTGRAWWEKVTL